MCQYCLRKGVVTAAVVADHIVPHKGDARLHWDGRLQALCHACHVGIKAVEERRGYSNEVGIDGVPIDPRHPCHAKTRVDSKGR